MCSKIIFQFIFNSFHIFDFVKTIRKVEPNVVVLELCESRLSILSFDEKSIMEESKTMGIAKMRRNIQEVSLRSHYLNVN